MGDEEEAHEVNKVVNRIKNYHLQDSQAEKNQFRKSP